MQQCIISYFRSEVRTDFVQQKLCLEEDLKADAGAVSQHGRNEGHEGLLVAILCEVMFPDLNIENIGYWCTV